MSNESYLPEGVELATLLDELRKVSWAAADVLMAYARGQEPPYGFPKSLTVEEGGDGPVSAADMAVNELLISGLKDNLSYKDWDILSEETSKEKTFQGSHYKKKIGVGLLIHWMGRKIFFKELKTMLFILLWHTSKSQKLGWF